MVGALRATSGLSLAAVGLPLYGALNNRRQNQPNNREFDNTKEPAALSFNPYGRRLAAPGAVVGLARAGADDDDDARCAVVDGGAPLDEDQRRAVEARIGADRRTRRDAGPAARGRTQGVCWPHAGRDAPGVAEAAPGVRVGGSTSCGLASCTVCGAPASRRPAVVDWSCQSETARQLGLGGSGSVSYTHLTLPTNREV